MLTQQIFISHSSEARKYKIKVPDYLFPGENPPSGLQMAVFLSYPHMTEREQAVEASSHVSSYYSTNPIMRAAPS